MTKIIEGLVYTFPSRRLSRYTFWFLLPNSHNINISTKNGSEYVIILLAPDSLLVDADSGIYLGHTCNFKNNNIYFLHKYIWLCLNKPVG